MPFGVSVNQNYVLSESAWVYYMHKSFSGMNLNYVNNIYFFRQIIIRGDNLELQQGIFGIKRIYLRMYAAL